MSFFNELKRRNVFRVGIAYAVASWVLLQLVDLVFEYITAPDWIMQVFMLALVIGLPLVLILAWVFELTPEGIKLESAIDPSQSVAPQTGRKLDRVIIIVLALAVTFLLADRFRTGSDSEPVVSDKELTAVSSAEEVSLPDVVSTAQKDKSIAVLPLVNRSIQPEDAFFAEGLHDELLTQLSRISALRVISRTSVMGYAGTTKRIPDIGQELGVATLLEGGVQRSGDRVRINVQLIESATDEHLWAEVYDRELTADNLFDIQSDITTAIANALQAVLTGEEQQTLEQKSTQNVEAYAYYLRGKAGSKGFGRQPGDIDKTISFFQAAIDMDPQFAAAYAALSIDLTERFWISDRSEDDLQQAFEALQQAQALAPESPETLTAEGYYHYWGHLDYASAIDAFDRVLQREPGNYLALRGKAYALRRFGQIDESITTMKKVISLDPLYGEIYADLGYSLVRKGELEQATAMANRAIALAHEKAWSRYSLTESLLVAGKLEQAWQTMMAASKNMGENQGYYLDTQLLIARAQASAVQIDQILDNYLIADAQSLGPAFSRGLVYLDRGEQNKLDTLLEEMRESVKTAKREQPGRESTLLGSIAFYALKKDRAKLTEAIKAYNAGVKPDALRIIENRTVPTAYAVAGDSEALLDYLEKMVEQFGPWEFYYFAIDPSFDSMRDLPRFQTLDKQYRQWLEQQR
jgi:TolB-like protein/Flp pilus assembly protein TadD